MAILLRGLVVFSLLMIFPWAQAHAQDPDAGAPGAKPSMVPTVVSANGFTCTQVGSGVNCKGAFKALDKNLMLSASGNQMVSLSAQKKDKTYSYNSQTGCLCETSKSSIKCTNEAGKTQNFKGKTMGQDSTSFCAGGEKK